MANAISTSLTQPIPMTLEAWAELPEDELGEVVDGFLVEEEVPDYVHEVVIAWLIRKIGHWGEGKKVLVGGSGGKFAVRTQTGRMPDLTVFLPGARRPPSRGLIRVPPSIAVEVVSRTARDEQRDRVEKAHEYASFGIPWYWLVDPELRIFEIWELDANRRYAQAVAVTEGRIDDVPGCAGLLLDVSALWKEIDTIEDDAAP